MCWLMQVLIKSLQYAMLRSICSIVQSYSRYSIMLDSLSDLTIGLWIFKLEIICYVRRIAMTNSALTKLTYHCR